MSAGSTAADILCTPLFTGAPDNELSPGIRAAELDSGSLPRADKSAMNFGNSRMKLGRDIWGAGTIADAPSVAEILARLAQEYAAARQRLGHLPCSLVHGRCSLLSGGRIFFTQAGIHLA